MAFTQTNIFTLTKTAKAMHSINSAIKKLQSIGLYFDGETTNNSISHDIFQSMDQLSEIFLAECNVYLISANMHDITGASLGTNNAEAALTELLEFIETEAAESDTEIMRFATEIKNKYSVKNNKIRRK